MNTLCFPELYKYDFNFTSIIAMVQDWKDRFVFSYLDTPRPNSGCMLVLCKKAIFTYKTGEVVTAWKEDVVYLPKGFFYKVEFFQDENAPSPTTILVNFSATDEQQQELNFDHHICVAAHADAQTYRLFLDLVHTFQNVVYGKLQLKAELYTLLVHLTELGKNSPSPAKCEIDRGLSYIDNHLNESTSIAEIARLCAMSESSFRKKFKDKVGISPVKYVNLAKIQKAKELLLNNDFSMEEIAAALHFYDTAYFYKVFKAHTGLTPIAYKKGGCSPLQDNV